MDTLCRVCIKKATKCTSLNTKIEYTSNQSFLDFLNKCTNLNACENDKLPQSLCSVCAHSITAFYSFVKLAEKSDIILREALKNSISTGRYNDSREISFEDITVKSEKVEDEESDDFNKDESFHCQTRENSTGSSLYVLDIVKEEPRVSERTSIVNFKDENDKFLSNLNHPEESVEEPVDVLSCMGGDLASSDSEDDVAINFLKKELIKNKIETDSERDFLTKTSFIHSNVKEKAGEIRAKCKETIKEEDTHSSSDGLICDICHRTFQTKIEYEKHIRIEHGSRKKVSSEDNDDTLKPKIREQTQENSFKCKACEMSFNNRDEFRTHCRNHLKGNKHECNICGAKFTRRKNLYNHLINHDEKRKYKCSICGKRFKHSTSRWRHMKMHSGEKPFECEICEKKFVLKDAYKCHLRIHTRSHKIADKKHQCNVCSKKFSSKRYLNIHMENHNGITKTCDQCDKEFKNIPALRRHMRRHIEPKPFKCGDCEMSFSRKDSLIRHMGIFKHASNSNGEPHRKGHNDNLVCKICNKQFWYKRYLIIHMENHKGITKTCDQCDKVFKNSDTLKRHMKLHINPKSFKCINCGKCFSRKDGLIRHMITCKPVDNSNEETIKIEELSSHSEGNKEIVVKVTQYDVNHSYESAEVPITEFYEVTELEEDNNSDELTGVCIKKVDNDS